MNAVLSIVNHPAAAQKLSAQQALRSVGKQISFMVEALKTADTTGRKTEPRTFENGKLKLVNSGDWTSGFFPGILWYMYDATHESRWEQLAQKYTANLSAEQYNTSTHDLGFMMYCSYGNGYRLTKNAAYKQVIIQSARSLCRRFNVKTGVLQSWDHSKEDHWAYPVIIDNMMNLELLFEATRLSGDSSFYRIAVSHADHTIVNHFRPDYSSYHVVDYDPVTGNIIQKNTKQGYSDQSAWARGQAWGLYGFTMCYRETGNGKYLQQAKRIAEFILNNPTLPKDMVPYWDYNDPAIPNAPRDASAAAIMASAFYELAGCSKQLIYRQKANTILASLTNYYRAHLKSSGGFILLHSTGHKPANSEVDVPLIYADYYYVEALVRSLRFKNM